MPFGLEQGPVYFTVLTQRVIVYLDDFCFFHMYEVLVDDFSENDHLGHLK